MTPSVLHANRLATRVKLKDEHIITRMANIAEGLEDVIKLGRGDPDLDTPAHIVKAGQDALGRGETHYGHPLGLPALRLRTFYFAMTTLGFATIVTQVALAWKPCSTPASNAAGDSGRSSEAGGGAVAAALGCGRALNTDPSARSCLSAQNCCTCRIHGGVCVCEGVGGSAGASSTMTVRPPSQPIPPIDTHARKQSPTPTGSPLGCTAGGSHRQAPLPAPPPRTTGSRHPWSRRRRRRGPPRCR